MTTVVASDRDIANLIARCAELTDGGDFAASVS